ncbi:MAG: TRAP transporter large permease [Thermodesulfobacteriota bacterium]
MDPNVIALITIGFLLALVLAGVDLAVVLGTLSFLGIWLIEENFFIPLSLIGSSAYKAVMEYSLSVVPMFILMAMFAALSGAADDAYDGLYLLLGKVKGGLSMATVLANAIFAAICGVSIASAAVFGKISLPQMERHGYDRKFALGTVAGSSILGMLIPPSVLLVVYGVLVDESIGKLFIAGVFPGILLTIIYCAGVSFMVRWRPNLIGPLPPSGSLTLSTITNSLLKPWQFIFVIVLTLGGIYTGWFTPTEAGAIGAFATFIMCIMRRKMTRKSLWKTILDAGHTMAGLYFLFVCATMYSRMLAITGLPDTIVQFVVSIHLPGFIVIALMIFVYLFLGTIIDSISIMILTIPLFFPVIQSMGFDTFWFAVVSVIAVEVGLITPPFGMVVFAMKATLGDEVTCEEIFEGSIPWILMMLLALLMVLFYPPLSTYLPHKMDG